VSEEPIERAVKRCFITHTVVLDRNESQPSRGRTIGNGLAMTLRRNYDGQESGAVLGIGLSLGSEA
jgi:hypothetical protein